MSNTNDNFIPANYDELHAHYFAGSNSLAQQLVRSAIRFTGDASDMREEILQDAFVKLMSMDIIARFDVKKANFGGMIFCAVRSIVGNYMGSRTRNPMTGLHGGSLSETSSDEFEMGTFTLDRMFATEDVATTASALDAKARIGRLIDVLTWRQACPANKRDRNLLSLLQLMADGYTPLECSARLKVTNSTIHNWMTYLQTLA